jgi:hypothetical protein
MKTAQASSDVEGFLREWHRVVGEKDLGAIAALLEEDVTLGAPPYWTKIEGKPIVAHLLGLILETIGDFEYRREWVDGKELALEFTGRVDGKELQGIDLISLGDNHRVASLDVLMRPLNGIKALREAIAPKMQAFLSQPR